MGPAKQKSMLHSGRLLEEWGMDVEIAYGNDAA